MRARDLRLCRVAVTAPAQEPGLHRPIGHRVGLVGRLEGVGRDVGLPFGVDVADAGTEVGVGRTVGDVVGCAVGVVDAEPMVRWVDTTPTTDG